MKKLINDPGAVVDEALHGFAAAHPDLVRVNYDPKYVVRADAFDAAAAVLAAVHA